MLADGIEPLTSCFKNSSGGRYFDPSREHNLLHFITLTI